jgi:hypothetical protein
MARRRRDLPEPAPVVDPVWAFRWLRRLTLGFEVDHPAGARLRSEAAAIEARGGSPEDQLEDLWLVVDQLGLRRAGERLLAHLQDSRERHGGRTPETPAVVTPPLSAFSPRREKALAVNRSDPPKGA